MKSVVMSAAVVAAVATPQCAPAGREGPSAPATLAQDVLDRDLAEVSVPQLHALYAHATYTVTQVVQWHLARISRYNGIYRAVEVVDEAGALKAAAAHDAAAAAGGPGFIRGPLWGVPILIKANTSIEGKVTTDGWKGFTRPGHELVAPKDATVVAKLKAAGAVILGSTNMPDFAASDTNRSSSFGRTGNAYDVRFSPGGSSGGTVTAVTSNMGVLGTGTDTGNSIRMPAATSAVVGVFPTRGLVSTAGIAPLDWLLDNTGPIARNVTDAAIALGVMAGEDPLDFRTEGSAANAQPGPYTSYLKADALKGKRFGVPAFVMNGAGIPFQGLHAGIPAAAGAARRTANRNPLQPETRAAFMAAIDGLKAAGATVVFDDAILPESFAETVSHVGTLPYVRQGTEAFLKYFGPAQYRTPAGYEKAVGAPLSPTLLSGAMNEGARKGEALTTQRLLDGDPRAEANYHGPRRRALEAYAEVFARLHLDGLVYPAIQMPPPDETMPQDGRVSEGPHSLTGWVNMIGVPAVVVPGGFYPSGLPFGLELAGLPWHDGDLLGYAFAYEQATRHRRPPVLVEKGLLPALR